MDNRQVAEAFAVETAATVETAGIVSEVEETSSPERYPNRFKPGKSGNPAGHPKKSREEEALLEQLKHLTPMALEQMEKMLKSERVAALAKVRIIEIQWSWDGRNATVSDVVSKIQAGARQADNMNGTVTVTGAGSQPAPVKELFPIPGGVRNT